MANTLLTPDDITREALRIVHQECTFIGAIDKQYDSSFANEGAKIGNTLRLRRPIEYTSSTGATMATGTGADSLEQSFTLTVNTQRHVPMRFNSNEMTMKIDDFSARHIQPAAARLAAQMESDVFALTKQVYNTVMAGTKCDFADVLLARKKIVDCLAPKGDRSCQLDTQANVDMVDELKGLFHDGKQVAKQYREGLLGRTASADFYENTILPTHATGAVGGTSAYLVNGASQTSTDVDTQSLIVDTGTTTIKAGDVFTIANVYRVHPETKVSTGELQQFVVLADATGAGTLSIAPGCVTSGPRKNVDSAPANNAALTFLGAASTTYKQSLFHHKNAFTLGSADLIMPKGVDMSSRQVYDGISMRLLRQYSIVKDVLYTRLDVLYGYRRTYNQHAARILHT